MTAFVNEESTEEVHCSRPTTGLRLDRNSLRETPQLEFLALACPAPVVTLQPDCFTGLTALVSLALEDCGLASIPLAVTALAGSLTTLALSCNDQLQLADGDIATLLALRELQQLNLRKSSFDTAFEDGDPAVADAVQAHLHYMPPLWSVHSMQILLRLPGAFLAEHGHEPIIEV